MEVGEDHRAPDGPMVLGLQTIRLGHCSDRFQFGELWFGIANLPEDLRSFSSWQRGRPGAQCGLVI